MRELAQLALVSAPRARDRVDQRTLSAVHEELVALMQHDARMRQLTVAQVFELCDAVPARFCAFIAVKTFASLRWGEISALRRRDVDADTGVVVVRAAYVERSTGTLDLGPPKSKASVRRVGLPAPVAAMLRAHLARFVDTDPDALVFTGPSGRPLRRCNFNKAVNCADACAAVGVRYRHLHHLRHTGNTPWPPAHPERQHAI